MKNLFTHAHTQFPTSKNHKNTQFIENKGNPNLATKTFDPKHTHTATHPPRNIIAHFASGDNRTNSKKKKKKTEEKENGNLRGAA